MFRLILSVLCVLAGFETLSARDLDTQTYHNASHIQWSWAILSLETLPLKGDEKLIDIGCGDGKITNYLASLVPNGEVLGIDPNEEAISFSKKNYESTQNLNFEIGKGENIKYEGEFDVACAFCSMHWMDDPKEVLLQIAKALRPGGKLLIVAPSSGSSKEKPFPSPSFMAEPRWDNWRHIRKRPSLSSMEEFSELAKEAGLTPIHREKIRTIGIFHDREDLIQWRMALNSDLKNLPQNLADEYFDYHMQLLQSLFPQAGDGRIYAFPTKLEMVFKKD